VNFLADENFPLPSVRILSAASHDTVAVVLESPGVSDESVLEGAVREARVLLTFDRDYGSLLYQRGLQAPGGIVYFRFVPFSLEEPAEYLLALLERSELSLLGMLTVAERDRIRQRPLSGGDRSDREESEPNLR
jgi:predicted nuclease of predicted toxin-antitoxin system